MVSRCALPFIRRVIRISVHVVVGIGKPAHSWRTGVVWPIFHWVVMYLRAVTSRDDGVDTIAEAFGQATVLMTRHLSDRAELSLTAADVLYRLHFDGPSRLTALASAVEISQPSMTQLVQRLERRDLVARSSDPGDRRAALVAITDGGRRLVLDQQDRVRDRLGELLALLPEDQRCALRLAAHVVLPIVGKLIELDARDEAKPASARDVELPREHV